MGYRVEAQESCHKAHLRSSEASDSISTTPQNPFTKTLETHNHPFYSSRTAPFSGTTKTSLAVMVVIVSVQYLAVAKSSGEFV